MKIKTQFVGTLLFLFLSLPSLGQAEELVATKMWVWKDEIQVQLETLDLQSGYIFDLKIKKSRVQTAHVFVSGSPARPFVDYCQMQEMVGKALALAAEHQTPPSVILYAPRDEIFGQRIDVRKRLYENSLPSKDVNLTKTLTWLSEILAWKQPCSPLIQD